MRIGIRVARTSGGGLVFVQELAKAMAEHPSKPEVTLLTFGSDLGIKPVEGVAIRSVTTSHNRLVQRIASAKRLPQLLRELEIDALICPGTESERVRGVCSVFWPLTVAPFEPETVKVLAPSRLASMRWRLLRFMILRSVRRSDCLLFSSDYARQLHVAGSARAARKPSRVILPGPSLPRSLAKRVDAGPFLFVSHLYRYKMVKELITGYISAYRSHGVRRPLLIVGAAVDECYAREINDLIESEGLQSHIQLLGNREREELCTLYAHAGAFVFTSISENAGSYALIDAINYGLPVVTSDRSSMPSICGQAVAYIDPTDISAIADSLKTLDADGELRDELSARAITWAVRFPTWPEIGNQVIDFLTEFEHCR